MTANAATDPDTGLRYYTWQGREYPSVTSIRRIIGMPFTLHNWAMSKVIERAITDHDAITDMMNRPRRPRERVREKNIIKEIKTHLRNAATEERDAAGDRGDRAHKAIEAGLSPDGVDPDIMGHVAQFQDAVRSLGATVLWQERQVWNLTYGYAGTGDALWQLPDGRIFVVDYKTSKGVYLDHAVQLVGYAMAEFVGEHDRVDAAATALLQQADGLAILHLSDNQWEWLEVRADKRLFEGFVGALAFANFLAAHDNRIDPMIVARRTGGTLVPALARGLKLIEGQKKEAQP